MILDNSGIYIGLDTKPQTNTKGGYTYSNTSASSTYTLLTNSTTYYNSDYSVIKDNPNTWTPYSTTVTKSIYDPCPYGYRVPINGSWDNWTSSTAWTQYAIDGGIAMQSSWWLACGYRNVTSAILHNIGYYGRYWSASHYPSYAYQAYLLYFDYSGSVYPSNNNGRSYGYAVRCIAE